MECPNCGTEMEDKTGMIPNLHIVKKLKRKATKSRLGNYWECPTCKLKFIASLVLVEVDLKLMKRIRAW